MNAYAGSFSSASAWLDDDERHVWVVHRCFEEKWSLTMLPWPNWQVKNGQLNPSIACACGYHDIPPVALSYRLSEALNAARHDPEFKERLKEAKARCLTRRSKP